MPTCLYGRADVHLQPKNYWTRTNNRTSSKTQTTNWQNDVVIINNYWALYRVAKFEGFFEFCPDLLFQTRLVYQKQLLPHWESHEDHNWNVDKLEKYKVIEIVKNHNDSSNLPVSVYLFRHIICRCQWPRRSIKWLSELFGFTFYEI